MSDEGPVAGGVRQALEDVAADIDPLTAEGGAVSRISMEIDGVRRVDLPVNLAEGETLAYENGNRATVYSSRWRALRSIPIDAALLHVAPGAHELVMDADLEGEVVSP